MFAYDFNFDLIDSLDSEDALFIDYIESGALEDEDAWKLCELD